MNHITIGSDRIPRLGYGCMGLTQAYHPVALDKARALLRRIADEGPVMLDTAATYSGGKNETLVGSVLKTSRSNVFLASKAGMYKNPDGSREIDGDPDRIIRSCEESLSRLGTEVLDLFYLHRVDHRVPVEESVGAIDRLISDGKVRYAGLSEVSRPTLERAMSVTKIHAVQSEYSLWSRRVEDGVLGYCEDNSIALVAYSPVGRGFLAGGVRDMTRLSERDIRHGMPRFQGGTFAHNLTVLEQIEMLGLDWGMTLAQVCLNWLWSRGDHVGAIPGTSELSHWRDDQGATSPLSDEQVRRLERLFDAHSFQGARYTPDKLAQLDSERSK
ncbi:MAG: aldo/keto reductase [Gammaproteobacteria bacterium]